MALLPYLMDVDLRPRRSRSLLDLDISPDDFLDVFDRPALRMQEYIRPWRNLAAAVRDVGSTIKSDREKFQVNLDVQHFAPEEISVKTADGFVVVEGKHEEKQDEHGYISRQFTRRYALPEDCNQETVESKLSSDGVLSITCPKKSSGLKGERAVPITHTGPVRRKIQDDESVQNGDVEDEKKTQSPQKKRRR